MTEMLSYRGAPDAQGLPSPGANPRGTGQNLCATVLVHPGVDADAAILRRGDRVILFQHEDDFAVEAVVDFRFVDELKRESWIATPDWSTKRNSQPSCRDSAAE